MIFFFLVIVFDGLSRWVYRACSYHDDDEHMIYRSAPLPYHINGELRA